MGVDANTDDRQEQLLGTLPSGTRVKNYQLVSVLGHGGFGITYQARDTTLGRDVAIKEYLPAALALRQDGTTVVPRSTQLAEDFRWGRDRFLDEARTLATLEGVPSIVRVYDFLEANGTAYMVMGLVRGETLERRLKREGTLSAMIAASLLERLLVGLEEVHDAGFLHRDIKPANIILDARDNPTLIDFGASRAAMADRSAALTAVFTPRYAAAEQLTSDKQGPWTDIYGLAATLYHAITGSPPPSSLERALDDGYRPLVELAPAGFPPRLLQGLDEGLRVRARDRPQSIAAWRPRLFSTEAPAGDATVVAARAEPPAPPVRPAAATAEPTAPAALPPPPFDQSARPAARRTRLALYAGTAAALLALVGAGYFGFATKPAPTLVQASKTGIPATAPGPTAGHPLQLDLAASKIELIDGRYALAGEIVNSGSATAAARQLTLVYRKGEQVLGQRTYSLAQGPIAPGGRVKFTLALDDPPPGATQLEGIVE
ncbi:MAG: serine/threonine protein kinase [Alphaproteobacteria bacterium]|nr:serine/threonine protein kinase [Alphaproteobacteria bacterium]